jgi:transcriptional regulator with XRE-family HTH domain
VPYIGELGRRGVETMSAVRKPKPVNLDDEAERAETRVKQTITTLSRYRGWSQSELAARTGIKRSNLNAKLSGETKVSFADAHRIATALGVPPEILVMDPKDALLWLLSHEDKGPLERRQRVISFKGKDKRSPTKRSYITCNTSPIELVGEFLSAS